MQPVKTKKGENLKVVSIVSVPKAIGEPDIILICINKEFKPVRVKLEDVETLGK